MVGIMQGRLSSPTSEKIQEFPWDSWEAEFQLAKTIDIQLIEWTLDLSGLYENPFMTSNGQIRALRLIKEHNVEVTSVTLDCFLDGPLHRCHPKSGSQSEMKDLIAVAESAQKLGVELGVLPLVAESGADNHESLLTLFAALSEIEQKCNDLNFHIALECEFELDMLHWVSKEIESFTHVGFNFDIGNSASLGNDPVQELAIYGDKLLNVHIKDRKLGGKTVPLGQGNADFQSISKKLIELNYNGNMILQAARGEPGRELETISNYLRFCELYGWR